jgi:hypothetical protein
MSRPTREQIEAARTWLGHAVDGCSIGGRNEEMIRILLAATAEPTEERPTDALRLRAKAHVALSDWLEALTGDRFSHDEAIVAAMKVIGARREGAR